jgi:hypothetical protein
MNKNLGSKKKARKAAFQERQAKRDEAKNRRRRYIEVRDGGGIEALALAMGIRLK